MHVLGLFASLDTHWCQYKTRTGSQAGITHYPLNSLCPSPMQPPLCSCLEDQICNLFHNASGSHTFSFCSPPPRILLFSPLISSRYCQLTDAAPVHTAFKINAWPSWSDAQQDPQHWQNSPWTLTQIGTMRLCVAIPKCPAGIGLLRICSTFPIPLLFLHLFPWNGHIGGSTVLLLCHCQDAT